MFGLPLAFTSPWLLAALVSLPVIWWLLRLTPPKPQEEVFPPTRILAKLQEKEETPAQSPWWLTLLRLLMAALVIFAMAGPVLNPDQTALRGDGPVTIVMDDGWASAQDWEARRDTALSIISEAKNADRTVSLISTSGYENWNGEAMSPEEAESLLQASNSIPVEPNHVDAAKQLAQNISVSKPGEIVWLSDGLSRDGTEVLSSTINSANAEKSVYEPQVNELVIIEEVNNEPSELFGNLTRAQTDGSQEVTVIARDIEGLIIARSNAVFEDGETKTRFSIEGPVELRNQVTRLEVNTAKNAAAVQLLDDNNKRRLVGLISGEQYDFNQPLLSPLYYISRALEPFSDLRRSSDANVTASVIELLNQGVSTIALADVGVITEASEERLQKWIENGGLLLRFSGPRLASSPGGNLLPVEIRPGDRNLGGALSWETPKALAAFERESPFFGINPPRDVLVKKQLLALQETNLEAKTWATLEDGTPLVTAEKRGAGWIVLFHVGSDAEWSNLPLSGTFVEMLRRTVNLSSSGNAQTIEGEARSLPPLRVLNGEGQFTQPEPTIKPLVISADTSLDVTAENPPGFYGTEDGFTALNLFEEETTLTPISQTNFINGLTTQDYLNGARFDFKIWLLVAAAILLLLDCLAVLWMGGALRKRQLSPKVAASIFAFAFALTTLTTQTSTFAQQNDENFDFQSALETRLAYVVTGVNEVDNVSEAGMRGLTFFISSRTALEPGDPIGLDISQDELSFYSLIYWPIDPRAELPSPETIARIDAYMKEGGSVLFDTKDQVSGVLGGTSASPAARTLQQILSTLDIPPLEPVPTDHVLTKSFYLLDRFPGRYAGGDLWVEKSQNLNPEQGRRPARAGDGVSSIMITSNDLAGAWAVDGSLRPLLPTIPPDRTQRNYAFRSGVNLMMYALTGNYKADQVHLPALLERLGQ